MKAVEWARRESNEARERLSFRVEKDALDFTEQVWRLMERQGMNKADLAKRLGTSRAYITKVMSGVCNQNLTVKTMERFVMALNAKIEIKVEPEAVFFSNKAHFTRISSFSNVVPIRKGPPVGLFSEISEWKTITGNVDNEEELEKGERKPLVA